MTDLDAVSALLMLSGGHQPTNEITLTQNISRLLQKNTSAANSASSSGTFAAKRRERKNGSPKQRVAPKSELRVAVVHGNVTPNELLAQMSSNKNVVSLVPVATPLPEETTDPNIPLPRMRMGSTSPDMEPLERENTLSPIVVQHLEASCSGTRSISPQVIESRRTGSPHSLYGSPGMNGFAMMLKSGGQLYTSSPEPSGEASRANRPVEDGGAGAIVLIPDKPARSPSDSGVSSILDEMLQPNLVLQRWNKDANIPECVQKELDKIIEISAYNKELYTKTRLKDFPLEMRFNPNKSHIRKKYDNEADHQDRVKNNEASRRSRLKKKLMTQMLNTGLEFDRQENRQLYMQERWLTNLIGELEEKALNRGIDAQIVRNLRAACGFQ
uniref:BZIP domain-containing protein n=1 Tax=Anopheles epiroticus TaxID=199890 RepID=A0A182PJR3_9DIPT